MPALLLQLQSSPYPFQEIYEALRLEVRENRERTLSMLSAWWERLKDSPGQHDAEPNVRNVCSECEHLLNEGESKCEDHLDAWVLAMNKMRKTELI